MELSDSSPKLVVAYIRKSSEDNARGEANKQLNSIEYQQQFAEEAKKKYGVTVVQTYQDDKTGYDAFIRPDFKRMLDFLKDKNGEIDGIVCTEVSRLARNFADGGMILWYLQNGTIKHIYTPSKVFTNSSSDQMMVAIELAMSKKSSDDTGYRTKEGMKTKALIIKHPARPAILGYYTEGQTGRKLWIIDPNTGPKVRQVFEQFATGQYTLQEIADYAYNIGLRSNTKNSTNGKLSKNTWHNRLRDAQYTGVFQHGDDRIVGEYEPLISPELFYAVQNVLSGNSHPKEAHLDYAYSGIVKCGLCGRMLSGTTQKGITYYRCDKRQEPCKSMQIEYVTEKKLEQQLLEELRRIEIDEKTWAICKDYIQELNQPENIKIKQQIRELGEQVSYEERIQLEIGRKYSYDNLSKTEHERLMNDSYQKVVSLKKTIAKCENISHELDNLMNGFIDRVKYVTQRLTGALPTNKRELVSIFCENLVWKDGKAHWDWRKPYYILAKQSKSSNVLPRVDSNHEP